MLQDFQHLALTVNHEVQKNSRYEAADLQRYLSSLQSRLMHLQGVGSVSNDQTQELVRLSLLAFLATTFKVPGRRVPYTWIAHEMQIIYAAAINGPVQIDRDLHIWILVIAAISVVPRDRTWLRQAWNSVLGNIEWQQVKRRLMGVVWFECIHDIPGETAHHQLTDTGITEL